MLALLLVLAAFVPGQDAAPTSRPAEEFDLEALAVRPAPPVDPAQVRAFQIQLAPNWRLHCDTPGFAETRVTLDVMLNAEGRLVGEPASVRPGTSPAYAAARSSALTALRRSEPFQVPPGFDGGRFRLVFAAARACANR